MREAALAVRREGDLIGVGLGVGDQFLHRLERHARMHDESEVIRRAQRDRREILEWIIGQFLVGVPLNNKIAALPADERVAVWSGTRTKLESELAGCTGAIVDDHILSEALGHLRPDQPRYDINRIAGRERNDDPYRLRRI